VEYVRFLQQIMPGQGDYSRERHQWLDGLAPEEIRAGIERVQKARRPERKKRT
jgi:hypothetical protein